MIDEITQQAIAIELALTIEEEHTGNGILTCKTCGGSKDSSQSPLLNYSVKCWDDFHSNSKEE